MKCDLFSFSELWVAVTDTLHTLDKISLASRTRQEKQKIVFYFYYASSYSLDSRIDQWRHRRLFANEFVDRNDIIEALSVDNNDNDDDDCCLFIRSLAKVRFCWYSYRTASPCAVLIMSCCLVAFNATHTSIHSRCEWHFHSDASKRQNRIGCVHFFARIARGSDNTSPSWSCECMSAITWRTQNTQTTRSTQAHLLLLRTDFIIIIIRFSQPYHSYTRSPCAYSLEVALHVWVSHLSLSLSLSRFSCFYTLFTFLLIIFCTFASNSLSFRWFFDRSASLWFSQQKIVSFLDLFWSFGNQKSGAFHFYLVRGAVQFVEISENYHKWGSAVAMNCKENDWKM